MTVWWLKAFLDVIVAFGTDIKEDGKLPITIRCSSASWSDIYSCRLHGFSITTPRPSNLTNAEIYLLQSSRNPTPRGSSFNHTDFYSKVGQRFNFGDANVYGIAAASCGPSTPRPSNYENDTQQQQHHSSKTRFHYLAVNPSVLSAGGGTPAPKNVIVASKKAANGQSHFLKPDDGDTLAWSREDNGRCSLP